MFLRGYIVRHVRTGKGYAIVLDRRDKLRIEATCEDAYAYTSIDEQGPIWVRPAGEMEDGRFVLDAK